MSDLFISNPEMWMDEVTTGNDFVCIVIFRGSWCKFDEFYLRKLGEFNKTTMEKEGVKLIAWTSEGAKGARKADEAWGLTKNYGYHMVLGDDTCQLAKFLKEDELLGSLTICTPQEAHVESLVPPGSYANGLAQPGMLWYAHHGSLALQWEAKVEPPHFGAANRPQPSELWEQVLKRKHALDLGNAIMPVHGRDLKMCTTPEDVN